MTAVSCLRLLGERRKDGIEDFALPLKTARAGDVGADGGACYEIDVLAAGDTVAWAIRACAMIPDFLMDEFRAHFIVRQPSMNCWSMKHRSSLSMTMGLARPR